MPPDVSTREKLQNWNCPDAKMGRKTGYPARPSPVGGPLARGRRRCNRPVLLEQVGCLEVQPEEAGEGRGLVAAERGARQEALTLVQANCRGERLGAPG